MDKGNYFPIFVVKCKDMNKQYIIKLVNNGFPRCSDHRVASNTASSTAFDQGTLQTPPELKTTSVLHIVVTITSIML